MIEDHIKRLKKHAYGAKVDHPSYADFFTHEDRKALRELIERYEYLLKTIQEAQEIARDII